MQRLTSVMAMILTKTFKQYLDYREYQHPHTIQVCQLPFPCCSALKYQSINQKKSILSVQSLYNAIGMDNAISELCHEGTIFQRNYRKIGIYGNFLYTVIPL